MRNVGEDKQRLMEDTPVGRLLFRMSGPSIIGVMAYNLYNVFDTAFISQGAGTDAVGGVAVSFPLFIFLSAVSSTLGNGAASVISRALGKHDSEKAARAAANTFGLFYAIAILITVVGLVWLDKFLMLMGVTETLMPYARAYTRIILAGAVTSTGFSNLIRAEGNSRYAMLIWVIPVTANIGLDILFIFVLHMGVIGAAAGTVIAQGISMAMSFYYFFISGMSVLNIRPRHFIPEFKLLGEVIGIGIPSFLQLSGQSAALIIVNQFLKVYGGDLAISAYGIANKIIVFFLFPIQGLAQGLQPVIGYNKGAGKTGRVKKAMKTASAMAGIYGIGAYALTFLTAGIFMNIFTSDRAAAQMGSHILWIVNASILFSGIQSMQTTYFQATGQKLMALMLALCGQLFCFVPAILILSQCFGLEGIWLAFPVSALAALILSSLLSYRQFGRL